MRNKLKLLSLDESLTLPPESPPSAAPPWTELPSDVTANILRRLGALEILQSAQLVCATWWRVCQDPAMWRVIKIEREYVVDDEATRCNIACRRAVNRSQGQVVDLTITYDGDAELLDYIVNRSSHLRRFTLESSNGVSRAAVIEAVKKLPELEEFLLLSNSTLIPADIESIATSCPSLNSFALKLTLAIIPHNEYAIAISKFMPRLQHLQLDGCLMDNTGLEAILDGCHHLQSLDLGGCSGVDLGGALGERCRGQIKDLVIPLHSGHVHIGDYCNDDLRDFFRYRDRDIFRDFDDYRERDEFGDYRDDADYDEYGNHWEHNLDI